MLKEKEKKREFYYTTDNKVKYILFAMIADDTRRPSSEINAVLRDLENNELSYLVKDGIITKVRDREELFMCASLATLFEDTENVNDLIMPSYTAAWRQPIGFLIDKSSCTARLALNHDADRTCESFDSETGEQRNSQERKPLSVDEFADIYRKQDIHYKNIAENNTTKTINKKEEAMKKTVKFNSCLHNELHLTAKEENQPIKAYSIFLSLTKNNDITYKHQIVNLLISLKTIIDKQLDIFGRDTIPVHFVDRGKKIGVLKIMTLKQLIDFCEQEVKVKPNEQQSDKLKSYGVDFQSCRSYLEQKIAEKSQSKEVVIENLDTIYNDMQQKCGYCCGC